MSDRTLSPRSAACTDAALAALASRPGALLCTGWIADATGYGVRYGQLLYRMLDRLAKRGIVGRRGGRGDPGLGSVHWQWRPSEGDCDVPRELVIADCRPELCSRSRGGCWDCQVWARTNLARPGQDTP